MTELNDQPASVRAPGTDSPFAPWHAPAGAGGDGGAELAEARQAFLGGVPVPSSAVRRPILASWQRSQVWDVRPDHLDLPLEGPAEKDTPLTRAAEPVLAAVGDLLATEPVSIILCDAAGIVLSRRTGDPGLERHLNRVWLAPGFSYAERYVGTNGIGTALESRQAARVFGHEHFVDSLEELACAGVPIRHPVSGKVLGVIDLTCWRKDAGPLLVAMSGALSRSIEQQLQQQAGRGELAVLAEYLAACKHNRGPVLAVAEDLLMMNDRARADLDSADEVRLLDVARDTLPTGWQQPVQLDLPSGRAARVTGRPVTGAAGVVGAVLTVQLLEQPAIPTPRRPMGSASAGRTLAVGSSVAWRSCCQAADRHLQAGEWLVLEGEPGSGRETVARAVHNGRMPAARLRVLRAGEAGPGWVDEVAAELTGGSGTLVLADVDRLAPPVLAELVEVLEPLREATGAERPWVVATMAPLGGDPGSSLAALLLCFPRTVQVPPLRRHVEDVAELVPHLLGRLGHGVSLRCSPEVMRMFLHNRWPGNVEQLASVLRRVAARRRAGLVEPADLPAECWVTGKRVLTPLESLECDAIVQALLESGGSKVEAARRLAMSRATIYRKVREYGIVLPSPVGSGSES